MAPIASLPPAAPSPTPPPSASSTATSPWRRRVLLASNAAALLLSESTRGLVLSSLFAYASRVAAGSGTDGAALLGYAVASFSAGRLVSSFALAAVAARGVPFARILSICFAVQVLGGVLYALCGSLGGGTGAAVLLVLSRFVVGFGSGVLPTCRAVVADVTEPAERTHTFAVLSFAKYAGYALVPGVGVFFGESSTVPAITSVAFAVAGWLLVVSCFDATLSAKGAAAPAAAAAPATAATSARAAVPAASPAAAAAPASAPQSLLQSPATLAFLVFLAINIVTKGALASAEAFIAPAFTAASAASARERGEGPELDPTADTAEFALALGAVGLLSYSLMAFKPQREKEAAKGGVAAPVERRGAESAAAAPAPASSSRFSVPLLMAAERPLSELEEARQGALRGDPFASVGRASGSPRRTWLAWAQRFADELDVLLLLASLVLTAVGACILGLGGGRDLSLAELSAGLVPLWSLAAPVADVLSVSCLSTSLSLVAPGSQALLMGYLSAGGSVGRILWPLGISAFGFGTSNALSATASLACAAAAAALYRRFSFLPGAGALRGAPCARERGLLRQLAEEAEDNSLEEEAASAAAEHSGFVAHK